MKLAQLADDDAANYWPSFTDVAMSMLLILVFFIFVQFLANADWFKRIEMEKRQKAILSAFQRELPGELRDSTIRVYTTWDRQQFTFSDRVLFDRAQAELKPTGVALLARVAAILKANGGLVKRIQVEGHTDASPIKTVLYRDNWELSSARATQVVKFFGALGVDQRLMSSNGFAEFRPIASGRSEQADARNRRIEILLLYDGAQITRPADSAFAAPALQSATTLGGR